MAEPITRPQKGTISRPGGTRVAERARESCVPGRNACVLFATLPPVSALYPAQITTSLLDTCPKVLFVHPLQRHRELQKDSQQHAFSSMAAVRHKGGGRSGWVA